MPSPVTPSLQPFKDLLPCKDLLSLYLLYKPLLEKQKPSLCLFRETTCCYAYKLKELLLVV
jgi:hypothetical protein